MFGVYMFVSIGVIWNWLKSISPEELSTLIWTVHKLVQSRSDWDYRYYSKSRVVLSIKGSTLTSC